VRTAAPLLLALVAGCGAAPVTIQGTVADDVRADSVWHFGGHARAALVADTFRLESLRGETVDLRFTGGDGLHARMEISDVRPGARVRLRGIWIDDDVAHASGVALEGTDAVTINGIRMGDPTQLPAEVAADGLVLAASGSGDALLVRPLDRGLPDLRVVATPATDVRTADGDPIDRDGARAGDTVRVVGATHAGYLVASELVLPRPAERRSGGAANGAEGTFSAEPAGAAGRAGGSSAEGRSEEGKDPGRGKGRGRGRGRVQGRGGGT
jgi:hypothetical protein